MGGRREEAREARDAHDQEPLPAGTSRIPREALRQALASLYDTLTLGKSAMVDFFPEVSAYSDPAIRAQLLRGLLLDGIEQLQPTRPDSYHSPATRSYRALTMRYVDGLTMAEIAEACAVSDRQAYRDLERGEDCLATLLTESLRARSGGPFPPSRDQALRLELGSLPISHSKVDLVAEAAAAAQTVSPLYQRAAAQLLFEPLCSEIHAATDPALFQQLLVQLLGTALRIAGPKCVVMHVVGCEAQPRIAVRFPTVEALEASAALEGTRQLALAQKIGWRLEGVPGNWLSVILTLRSAGRLALIVEDNVSAVHLYSRYLDSAPDWAMVAMEGKDLTVQAVQQAQPDVVVLDIMMPAQSGWSILQQLRSHPATEGIPVIVCTVFDEEELALGLGAAVFLRKPVSRSQFLEALQGCCP